MGLTLIGLLASGAPAGAAEWSTPFTVSPRYIGGSSAQAAFALTPDRLLFVDADAPPSRSFAEHVFSTGATSARPLLQGDAYEPQVEANARGDAVAVWRSGSDSDSPHEVWVATRRRGEGFGEPQRLGPEDQSNWGPVARIGAGGRVIVVFNSQLATSPDPDRIDRFFNGFLTVRYAVGAVGGKLGPDVQLSRPSRSSAGPRLGCDRDGGCLIAWDTLKGFDKGGIDAATVTMAGRASPPHIVRRPGDALLSNVLVAPSGRALVAWQMLRRDGYFARVLQAAPASTRSGVGKPNSIRRTRDAGVPLGIVDGRGRPVLAWQRPPAGGGGIIEAVVAGRRLRLASGPRGYRLGIGLRGSQAVVGYIGGSDAGFREVRVVPAAGGATESVARLPRRATTGHFTMAPGPGKRLVVLLEASNDHTQWLRAALTTRRGRATRAAELVRGHLGRVGEHHLVVRGRRVVALWRRDGERVRGPRWSGSELLRP